MKNKITVGLLSFALGLFAISCNDDMDYSIASGTLVTEIATGSADVTANSAELHGTVKGLESQSSAAYEVGVKFGTTPESLTANIGTLDGNTITVSKTELTTNTTYYYQAYVTLQNKVTYTGEVKSLITTDAKVATKAATGGLMKATVGGTLSDYPTGSGVTCGVVMSMSSNVEDVRAGLILANSQLAGDFAFEQAGLLPGKTYYYAAYINLGSGIVYGDVKSFTTQTYELDIDNDFVDLGLSKKWAKYNMGASSEAEYGGLFAYGDLTGLNNSTKVSDYVPDTDIYLTQYDICYSVYPNTTLPTSDDFAELFNSCTSVWTTKEGVSGYEFTGPNGNKLFLPAAGSRTGNNLTDQGNLGTYLTGSINSGNKDFNLSYAFGNGFADKAVSPRYTALAVRPVSPARNVPFLKELLNNTWFIDVDVNATSLEFKGPVYFYGTDDSWATVSNKEPIIGDSWAWEASQADWICPAKEYGSMKFNDDNTVTVVQIDANGLQTTSTGTYTVDEEHKTVSLSIDLLTPYNFSTENGDGLTQVNSKRTDLRILSLAENTLQIAVVRTNGPAQLSINYVSNVVKNGYQAKLTCYGSTNDANADTWSSAVSRIMPTEGKQFSVKFLGQRNAGEVYIVDIADFKKDYPNSVIRVDGIKVDGSSITYDANKFFFGDIENKGTYRIELFNKWGAGHNDSWTGVKDSPFGAGGEKTEEPLIGFNESFEVLFTIVSLETTYSAGYTSCDSNWNSSWPDGSVALNLFPNFAPAKNVEYQIKVDGSRANGMINLIEMKKLFKAFPNSSFTLNKVECDGTVIPFEAAKILKGELESGSGNYRIELYNTYGASKGNPAFSGETAVGDNTVIPLLGYTTSTTVTFTLNSLY
jgi:hypothetical protein